MVKKIGSIARKLIDGMSDIVWLINPKRDSLTELFIKVKDNFEEILSYSNILLHFGNLDFLEKVKLPMDYRKNLYLIFKEAMNNSVKHSSCSNIWVEAKQEGKFLIITLKDDGKGFNTSIDSGGNGLLNMRERAKTLKGQIKIESLENKGTEIMFKGKI
jgi:signal transduction histidine kinase